MLLAIDVGNTNTVFAICDGDEIKSQWRISTSDARTADELIVWLDQLMRLNGATALDINEAIISSVVPQALFSLRRMCQVYFGTTALVVGQEGFKLGFDVRIAHHRSVGADRLVNTVGAHIRYPGALIVIDFGTATTFDIVSSDGAYEGGIIAPGINLSLQALHQAAAQLPLIAIRRPERVVGQDTEGAMQSGIFWGYVGLIEGLIARIKAERDEPMTVIATGGLASLFKGSVEAIDHADEDLTISGLIELNRRNKKTKGA